MPCAAIGSPYRLLHTYLRASRDVGCAHMFENGNAASEAYAYAIPFQNHICIYYALPNNVGITIEICGI